MRKRERERERTLLEKRKKERKREREGERETVRQEEQRALEIWGGDRSGLLRSSRDLECQPA